MWTPAPGYERAEIHLTNTGARALCAGSCFGGPGHFALHRRIAHVYADRSQGHTDRLEGVALGAQFPHVLRKALGLAGTSARWIGWNQFHRSVSVQALVGRSSIAVQFVQWLLAR